jgi:hypothetical protein
MLAWPSTEAGNAASASQHSCEESIEAQSIRNPTNSSEHRKQERDQWYKCQQDLAKSGMDLDEPVIDQPEPGANVLNSP